MCVQLVFGNLCSNISNTLLLIRFGLNLKMLLVRTLPCHHAVTPDKASYNEWWTPPKAPLIEKLKGCLGALSPTYIDFAVAHDVFEALPASLS